MNAAVWRKAIRDAWLQLAASSVLLILFGWCFVWLMSLFRPGMIVAILDYLPSFVEPLVGVPLAKLATATGRISVLYVHVVTLLVCLGWAIGRGSDVVSGEISRGTMDFLATLPVRRAWIVVSSATVTAAGALVLSFSVWLGSLAGLATVALPDAASPRQFLPGVVNLFSMTFCLAGVTALFSAWDRSRWRTALLAGGFFVVSSIVKLVARLWTPGAWLTYLSVLTPFEPQKLILLEPEVTRPMAWKYNAILWTTGVAAYGIAAVVFSRRDVPAAY
jgi:ABC-2 type transport system permease protein